MASATFLVAAAPASAACSSSSGAARPAVTGTDAYSTAVLADGPIAYYRLDEISGPTMCDSSASANDGTYNSSGITYGVPGALLSSSDTAVSADGTPGVIGQSDSNSPIGGNQSFTLEGWFRSTGSTPNEALVDIGQAGVGNAASLSVWPTAGTCAANALVVDEFSGYNCWDPTTVGVNLLDGHWHYLAATYDATSNLLTAYVDGQSLGAQTPTNSLNLSESPIRVGHWVDTVINQPYQGDADEVAVYPTALTASRILTHYQAAGYASSSPSPFPPPTTTTPPPTTTTTPPTTTPPVGTTPPTTTTTQQVTQPTITPSSPVVQSSTSAGFTGIVNPEGALTTAYFQYGLDPSYTGGGAVTAQARAHASAAVTYTGQVTAQPDPVGSDFSSHTVTASASDLVPNALYHVRLVAVSSVGTAFGPDQTFMTKKDPPPGAPVLGQSFNAVPVSGQVYVRLPGSSAGALSAHASRPGPRFVPLTEVRQLPMGTQVDTRSGTIKLINASGKKNKLQNATFNGAIFRVTQSASGANKGLTTVKLLYGIFAGAPSYGSCKAKKAQVGFALAHIAVSGSVLSTLHSRSHGRYSSSGHYGSATSRGTAWTLTDRCDGTLIKVQKDVVVVRDFVRHKSITLRAGQSYLVRK